MLVVPTQCRTPPSAAALGAQVRPAYRAAVERHVAPMTCADLWMIEQPAPRTVDRCLGPRPPARLA
jgi:hypothetical protein